MAVCCTMADDTAGFNGMLVFLLPQIYEIITTAELSGLIYSSKLEPSVSAKINWWTKKKIMQISYAALNLG